MAGITTRDIRQIKIHLAELIDETGEMHDLRICGLDKGFRDLVNSLERDLRDLSENLDCVSPHRTKR